MFGDEHLKRNLHSIKKLTVASLKICSNKTETKNSVAVAAEFHRHNAAEKKIEESTKKHFVAQFFILYLKLVN